MQLSNSILIGANAGRSLAYGQFNVLLGDGAGEELKEAYYLFILKTSVGTVRKTITEDQWRVINDIIMGATLELKEEYSHGREQARSW